MIDKVFPRKLNSSKDTRLHGKDEMIDAVNVTIDDNYQEFSSGVETGSGNFGVLKPITGNSAVNQGTAFSLADGSKVIGSCNDERAGRIYYFVYSPTNAQNGVYYYDTATNSINLLIADSLFNFNGNSYIDGNVVYVANADTDPAASDLKPLLFFTDNLSEPKKIDIQRVSEAGSGVTFLDFVTACPRTPMNPPIWTFQSDPEYKVSNFRGERGFQFAYQNIYKTGDVSALSTYSTLAVPSAYLNQGSTTSPNFFAENRIAVIVPNDSLTSEVARVRILARSGNQGSWLIIDEQDYSGSQIQSNFYNDETYTVLTDAEARKQFDSLPKRARTQDVVNNRLFYANYAEGFDVPKTHATISHAFLERPTDFISVDLTVTPEIRQVNDAEIADNVNRVASYKISAENLDEVVFANTQVIFNIAVSPDGNFHFYESRDSFHGFSQVSRPVVGSDGEEANVAASLGHQGMFADMASGQTLGMAPSGLAFFNGPRPEGFLLDGESEARRYGITSSPLDALGGEETAFPRWDAERSQDAAPFRASYGTSAQNPFILQGSPCEFSGSFVTLTDINRTRLIEIIKDILIDNYQSEDSSLFDDEEPLVSINSVQNKFSYNIDLNIQNKDKIGVFESNDYRSKLVVAVGAYDELRGADTRQIPPCGYFIVNKAKPTIGFRDITAFNNSEVVGNQSDIFVCLDLFAMEDVEFMTCIPDVAMGKNLSSPLTLGFSGNYGNLFDGFRCFTPEFIKDPNGFSALSAVELGAVDGVGGLFKHNAVEIYSIVVDGEFAFEVNDANGIPCLLEPNIEGANSSTQSGSNLYKTPSITVTSADDGNLQQRNMPQIARWFGSLLPTGSTGVISQSGGSFQYEIVGGKLIYTFADYANDVFADGSGFDIRRSSSLFFNYAFSMIDGEAGVGVQDGFAEASSQNRASLTHSNITMGFGSWLTKGESPNLLLSPNIEDFNQNMGLLNVGQFFDVDAWKDYLPLLNDEDTVIVSQTRPAVEVSYDVAIVPPEEGSGTNRSFKTSATHDFGIVYYDQRGRSSDVSPLGSVYVGGYDASAQQGPVQVQISLTSAPPEWAWHYQIVYGGNNTISEFVQYTSGGAFVEQGAQTSTSQNGNIYVSLNYLQHDSNVSYSKSFGAVSTDGSKDLYTFQEGDKLRVISYYNNSTNRVYPSSYDFDIVGVTTLADDEDNPLIDQNNPPAIPSKTGQFLILRDNPEASGFSYNNVRSAQINNTSPSSTSSHLWNSRCVIEIYRPKDVQGVEDRVYYEISKKYNVIRDGGIPTWENNNIVLSNGDVWFRRVAVNMPTFSESDNKYINILGDTGLSTPLFRDYYLESMTFTDVIAGANQYDYGKPKIMNRFQKEIRRDSSVTFSDSNVLADPVVRYTSFDAATVNFKDLPNKYGQISKIVDYGDSLFILNEDKVSAIPIARSLLSDLSGQEFVVASDQVMGTQKFYAGDSGCSTNPESVVKVGESLYFANKERHEVYKFNPSNGVVVISNMGMKSYFRNLFETAIYSAGIVRVVGGYDPVLDEYVLSVYNQLSLSFPTEDEVLQPTGTTLPDEPITPIVIDDGSADIIQGLQEQVDSLSAQVNSIGADYNILTEELSYLYDAASDITGEGAGISSGDLADSLTNFVATLSDTSEATAAIDSLTTQVNGLVADINSIGESLDSEANVSDILSAINLINIALTSSDESIVSQIVSVDSAQASLKDQIDSATEVMSSILSVVDERFDDGEAGIPFNSLLNHFPDIASGGTLSKETLVLLLEAYDTYIKEAQASYSNAAGLYIRADQSQFTDYVIGFGNITTEALEDSNPINIPPDSAIGENPNFISEVQSRINAVVAYNSLLSTELLGDVSQLLQINTGLLGDITVLATDLQAALADQGATQGQLNAANQALSQALADLAAEQAVSGGLSGQVSSLQTQNSDLIQRMSSIITAIYNTQARNYGEDAGTGDFLFSTGFGGIVSPTFIETLYSAVQNNTLVQTLEENKNELEALIKNTLEEGIYYHNLNEYDPLISTAEAAAALAQGQLASANAQISDLNQEISGLESQVSSLNSSNSSLQLTNSLLLMQVFYSFSAIYELAGKPEVMDQIPASVASLLTADSPTPEDILAAFDTNNDGAISEEELIDASLILSEFQQDVIDNLTPVQEVSADLRAPIENFFTGVEGILSHLKIDGSLPTDWSDTILNGTEEEVTGVISAFGDLLYASEDGSTSVLRALQNLQLALRDAFGIGVTFNTSYGAPTTLYNQNYLASQNGENGNIGSTFNTDEYADAFDQVSSKIDSPFGGNQFVPPFELRSLSVTVSDLISQILQWQRYAGDVLNESSPSFGGVFGDPTTYESVDTGPKPSDWYKFQNTTYRTYPVDGVSSNGFNGTALSLMPAIYVQLNRLYEKLSIQTEYSSFHEGGFFFEATAFDNYFNTGSIADFIGPELFNIAKSEIEA